MVRNKVGTALCFDIGIQYYDDLLFVPFSPTLETGSVLVWEKNQILGTATQRFIEFIKNALQA